jgi:hypothetical protein
MRTPCGKVRAQRCGSGMGNRNGKPRGLPPEASTASVRRVHNGDVVVLCVDGAPLQLISFVSSSNDSMEGADDGAAHAPQYALVPAAPGAAAAGPPVRSNPC